MALNEGDELDVTIVSVDSQGRGLCEYEGRTIHVADATPGENVRIRITKVRSLSYLAEITEQINDMEE